jgi:hypothetical protein
MDCYFLNLKVDKLEELFWLASQPHFILHFSHADETEHVSIFSTTPFLTSITNQFTL